VCVWNLVEHRPRVSENRVLKNIFGPKRAEEAGGWRNCVTKRWVICSAHQTLVLGVSNEAVWDRQGM
jgi:hypothetical protein